MESNQPRKASTAFEYFLYAAILAETLLAAMVYKTIFGSGELVHLRVYLAILYLAFLGWAIAQLNRLHRNRKSQIEEAEPAVTQDRPILGLTGQQLITVVVVFATAIAAFTWVLRTLG
jgi:hypothetical protein